MSEGELLTVGKTDLKIGQSRELLDKLAYNKSSTVDEFLNELEANKDQLHGASITNVVRFVRLIQFLDAVSDYWFTPGELNDLANNTIKRTNTGYTWNDYGLPSAQLLFEKLSYGIPTTRYIEKYRTSENSQIKQNIKIILFDFTKIINDRFYILTKMKTEKENILNLDIDKYFSDNKKHYNVKRSEVVFFTALLFAYLPIKYNFATLKNRINKSETKDKEWVKSL